MNSTSSTQAGSEETDDTTGCIGFDVLGVYMEENVCEERIRRKVKIIVSTTVKGHSEFRRFLVSAGKCFYLNSKQRGAVVISIQETEFDGFYKRIKKCHDIFSDPKNVSMDTREKIQLMEYAFPPLDYYELDEKHLVTKKNIEKYNTYDTSSSCIVFICIHSHDSQYIHNYIGVVCV